MYQENDRSIGLLGYIFKLMVQAIDEDKAVAQKALWELLEYLDGWTGARSTTTHQMVPAEPLSSADTSAASNVEHVRLEYHIPVDQVSCRQPCYTVPESPWNSTAIYILSSAIRILRGALL